MGDVSSRRFMRAYGRCEDAGSEVSRWWDLTLHRVHDMHVDAATVARFNLVLLKFWL